MKEISELSFTDSVKYSKEHTWAKEEDQSIIVGISDYAQDRLGEIIFVELPEIGDSFEQDEEFGSIESVKSVSQLYMPVSGEIIEINPELESTPEIINEAPFSDGWMIKVKPAEESQLEALLAADEYKATLG